MARGDKGTKRRDNIVDEATRLFGERGYEGASMADLAERVGLRKASLFHHFPSKEQLYAAVLERPARELGAAVDRALSGQAPFEERLDALSDALVDVLGSQPFAARLLVREAMEWTSASAGTVVTAIDAILRSAEAFLGEGQERGIVAEGDVRQIVVSVLGVLFMPFAIGGALHRLVGSDPFSAPLVASRKSAVKRHVRGIVLKRPD
jgi:AcrR family transcriptional regulator